FELRGARVGVARELDRGPVPPERGPARAGGALDLGGAEGKPTALAPGNAHHVAGSVGRELDRDLGLIGFRTQKDLVFADLLELDAPREDPRLVTGSVEIALDEPAVFEGMDRGRVALRRLPIGGVVPVPRSVGKGDTDREPRGTRALDGDADEVARGMDRGDDAYRVAVADEPAADDAAPELQSLLRPLDVVSAQRAAVGRREADAGEVEAVRIRAEPSRRGRARGGVLHLFEVRDAAPADIMPAGRIGEVVVAFARDRVPCPL